MKYYQIMESPLDLIKSYIHKCHINDPRFIGKHNNRSKINFEPIVSDLVLKEGQTIPDYFSAGGMLSPRAIISSQLKFLLEKNCENGCLEFFPVTLFQENRKIENYWITNSVAFFDESLDFEISSFLVSSDIPIKNKYGIPLNSFRSNEIRRYKSFSEFLNVKEQGWGKGVSITPAKLYLKESEKRPLLLFDEVPILGITGSEKLKKELEENRIKGIEFKPLEISDEEWGGPNGLRKQFYC